VDAYRLTVWVHLFLAVLVVGLALFWFIMDVSLRRRFDVAQANGWLKVVRGARWPHVAVPYALRLPLPLLTFAILGIMIATGILTAHLGGRVTEGTAWSAKYALAGALLFTQAWLAWQPSRGIIRINLAVALLTLVASVVAVR
jgi:hypothetical protein